jgi:cardiolipin synthase
MLATLRNAFEHLLESGFPAHLFAIAGFLLAFSLVARLMSEKRAPANTFAWLLVIVLLPYVGVPLYLLIGGRKLRRILREKSHILPALPGAIAGSTNGSVCGPIATTVVAAGGLPPVSGNRVRLLSTGEDEFAALEENIRSAKSCIHITTFILSRDDTGRRIVRLLADRAREGVKVRLLLDAVGCLTSRGPLRGTPAAGRRRNRPVHAGHALHLPRLGQPAKPPQGGGVRPQDGTDGRAQPRPRIHGTRALPKRWRDLGAAIEGPAAYLLNEVFIADWCFATRQSPETLHAEIPAEAFAAVRGERTPGRRQRPRRTRATRSTRGSSR